MRSQSAPSGSSARRVAGGGAASEEEEESAAKRHGGALRDRMKGEGEGEEEGKVPLCFGSGDVCLFCGGGL
eukprot:3178-Rhodomonas_salina.1